MNRLTINPPLDTLLPQRTAVRLLRIMLTVALLPTALGSVAVWAGLGAEWIAVMLMIMGPIGAAWVFVMLPGLDRRLGARFLPIALGLTITAQTLQSSRLAA